jgi:glycosyltransferase involved in cell wall biosynthesis
VLVLTTSFPSDDDDPSGIFIAKLLIAIRKLGYRFTVIAPSDGTVHGRRTLFNMLTVRFGYFVPRSMERLTKRGGGIPENMSKSLLARLQLLPMMIAFFVTALKHARRSDIMYANWLGAGIIGAAVNMLTGKPLLVSFRGDDGYLARDRPLWRMLTKWVSRRAARLAPVSAELVDILIDLGVPKEKCVLPRFGVDTDMFHPAPQPEESRDHVNLLFVGSLIPRKGLHDLLEALGDPDLGNVRLTVIGEGYYLPELLKIAERNNLADRVDWKDTLPPGEVADLMRHADIVCLPSYMEGRPNVVNEAMASGVPVISTRIGGIPDMVMEGKTALLYDAGNIPELANCLKTLTSDAPLREDMGNAGHNFLKRSGVSWDSTAAEFDAIFSVLLGKDVTPAGGNNQNQQPKSSG